VVLDKILNCKGGVVVVADHNTVCALYNMKVMDKT
jgi:hypothetical protein